MQCELCGVQAAVIKKTTKSFGRGDNLEVIERVTAELKNELVVHSVIERPNY